MLRMYPRFKPQYNLQEIAAALIPSRKAVTRYEKEFAEMFQRSYGVMFNYGRTALYALFKIWNLENAEIICPAYTCVVVAHAIVLSGNIPVFVDCEPNGFNMSLAGIRDALSEKTGAVIVTHIFGNPMDVEAVEKIVAEAEVKYRRKIYIIQDCAHSFGAYWQGRMVTTSGDAAIFGLNISKTINSVFGGMAITNDAGIYAKLMEFRAKNCRKPKSGKSLKYFLYFLGSAIAFNRYVYRLVFTLEKHGKLNRFTRYYDEGKIDFPSDWNDLPCSLQARIGRKQLQKYPGIIRQRVEAARRLPGFLSHLTAGIQVPPFCEGSTYSHLVGITSNRDERVAAFEKKGIQLGTIIDYSVPEMKAYQQYRRGDYPRALFYSKSLVNFPLALASGGSEPFWKRVPTPPKTFDNPPKTFDNPTKSLVVTGDDKICRRLISRLEKYEGIAVYINKGRSWQRIYKILKKKRIRPGTMFKMAWAEWQRPKENIKEGTHTLQVIQTNHQLLAKIKELQVQRVFLFRVGLIISGKVLESGVDIFNIHCADLPRYKGLGAIDKALRDKEFSQFACLIRVDQTIDGGEIIAKKPFLLSASLSYRENEDNAYNAGIELLLQHIAAPAAEVR